MANFESRSTTGRSENLDRAGEVRVRNGVKMQVLSNRITNPITTKAQPSQSGATQTTTSVANAATPKALRPHARVK